MKNILILLVSLFTCVATAQISFNSGSAQLDSDLNTINTNANLNFSAFKADLSLNYNVSKKKIEYMKGTIRMAPGEIYLALEIAKLSKISVDNVLKIYKRDKRKGWGYIAKQAGIKPGSAEFHRLKNNASTKKNKGKGKGKAKSKKKKG